MSRSSRTRRRPTLAMLRFDPPPRRAPRPRIRCAGRRGAGNLAPPARRDQAGQPAARSNAARSSEGRRSEGAGQLRSRRDDPKRTSAKIEAAAGGKPGAEARHDAIRDSTPIQPAERARDQRRRSAEAQACRERSREPAARSDAKSDRSRSPRPSPTQPRRRRRLASSPTRRSRSSRRPNPSKPEPASPIRQPGTDAAATKIATLGEAPVAVEDASPRRHESQKAERSAGKSTRARGGTGGTRQGPAPARGPTRAAGAAARRSAAAAAWRPVRPADAGSDKLTERLRSGRPGRDRRPVRLSPFRPRAVIERGVGDAEPVERERQHAGRDAGAAARDDRRCRDRRRRLKTPCADRRAASSRRSRHRTAGYRARCGLPGMWPERMPGRGSAARPSKRSAARASITCSAWLATLATICCMLRTRLASKLALKVAGFGLDLAALDRAALGLPLLQAAIEHAHIAVAVGQEHPPRPRARRPSRRNHRPRRYRRC